MRNRLVLFSVVFFFFRLTAQIPSGYYNSAQGLTGSNLKTALHNIIKNHTVVSYNSLWNHFQDTDKKSNGKVWDIYSDIPGGTPPYEYTFSTNQCGSYNSEADCYNREHSWPQSWFNSENIPSSDLFHIYPTDGYVNNMRSNYPYGDVSSPTWTSQNGSKLGPCTDGGYSQTVFEPIDEYKGDLARGYFYMSTRYEGEDASWNTSAATNKSVILPWQVDVLVSWHHSDPVSNKEIDRNNAVYQIQNNRNPYIDNPQWIDSIWFPAFTGSVTQTKIENNLLIYPNPAMSNFFIAREGAAPESTVTVVVYSALGQEMKRIDHVLIAREAIAIDCSDWNKGVYYLKSINSTNVTTHKLIKE
jgi:endonuclease I